MSPHRTPARLGVLALATATALAGLGGVASAHVTVGSADAAPGGYGKLTFRVPNESDTASTTSIRIQVPQDPPLTSLRAQPVPGWSVTLTTSPLPEPVDGATESVSVVEFTADPGPDSGVGPGEFQEFALSGGPFPEQDELTFAVVQRYSDGSEAAWIDPTVEGQPEPEHPAPVLSLTGQTASGDGHGGTPTSTAVQPAAAQGSTDGTAVTALVLAVVGLLAGLAGLALGWRASRRTVSS